MNTTSLVARGAADLKAPARSAPEGIVNGATVLIDTLLALGVDTVFGYPGGAVLPLYDALHARRALRHVLVRHEQAAVHAAQGYARTTGKVGVVFVTSGPGMSNTTTGLLDALCDSVPVLCISGQVATTAIGTDAFQECDALGISRPVTKWNAQVRDVDAVAATLQRAHAIACGGRPGPVLVDVPKDVQLAPARPAPRDAAKPAVRAGKWVCALSCVRDTSRPCTEPRWSAQMTQVEQLEMDAHRSQLTADLRQLIDKYRAIFGWDMPELDEALSEQLIVQSLRRALDDLEQRAAAARA